MRFILFASGAALALASAAPAQVASPLTPATLTSSVYSQNFDTLAASGTSNAFPAGFGIVETGANADGAYAAGAGGSNGGNSYSFGAAGSSERAIGAVTSGNLSVVVLGGVFTNALGATITSLTVAYTGEQWRFADGSDTLAFEYSTDATTLLNGSWTRASALDFATLVTGAAGGGALDGNVAANRRAMSATLSNLTIRNGGALGLRWTQRDVTGSDAGLAIDDLSLTAATAAAATVAEPSSWALMVAGFAVAGVALRRRSGLAAAA